ncbi:MAG: hypothetical protein J7639_18845 [Paenibacillaceae bacterium]|nr:hypothetical protein [Paenibacillaceae bacterium]
MDKWLRDNNVVKVVAVLISVLLWVVVHMDSQNNAPSSTSPITKDVSINNVNVTVNYDKEQYNIVSMDPPEVTVLLTGTSEAALKKMNTSTFKIEADLTGRGAGTHSVVLRAVGTTSIIPNAVKVEIVPQTVRVVLEEKQKKEVPVVINVTGSPAPGYKAGQPVIKPNRVHVTVPSSMLDQVESARAEVSVDKATGVVSKQVKLVAYGKDGKPIDGTVSPQVVDVEIPITNPFKTMPLPIKTIGRPAAGYAVSSLQQKVDQVTVYAPQDVLDKLDFYDGLQIDLSGLTEDKTFTLDVPLKDKVTQVDPAKIEIKVSVVPSQTRTVDNIPLRIIGQSDGYTTTLVAPENQAISAVIEGAQALLNSLKLQDVQAIVDVSNLPPGKHDVAISLNLPAFLMKAAQQQELKATVEIAAKGASPTPSEPAGSAKPATAQGGGAATTATPSPTPKPSASASGSPANPSGGSASPGASATPRGG